ncbi:MAG: hypothetical protein PVG14_04955 [Anaerolineales bacterium]|jgi:hypothetical protein
MAKIKFDGVVVAVRYEPNGKIDWVRAYERRGFTFSDRVMLHRDTLLERLDSGLRFVVGQRVPYKASTFTISDDLRVIQRNGDKVVVTGDAQTDHDQLEGVPII